MLEFYIQSEIAVIRYQIKQKKADYEEEIFNGADFNQLKTIQIEIKQLEDRWRSYLQPVEDYTN